MGNLHELDDVRFRYTPGKYTVDALRGVTLPVSRGACLCLKGPSGSGKTPPLNLFGLIEPMPRRSAPLRRASARGGSAPGCGSSAPSARSR